MRIVIDMQGAQSSGSRHRGIGRYTMALALAMVRNCGSHDIHLALSGQFPESIDDIKNRFSGLLSNNNIHVWFAPTPACFINDSNITKRKDSEKLYWKFLNSLEPDIIHITNLFEGLTDDAVSYVSPCFPRPVVAVTLYDLIPYLNPNSYLSNSKVKEWYLEKVQHLKCADLWLAISDSSRSEGEQHLHLPSERCVNISSDVDPIFQELTLSRDEEICLREKYCLRREFVMYTGGIDHRKNVEGLIRAFALLPTEVRNSHQLAIVCSIQPADRARLSSIAVDAGLTPDQLILTGFIPDDDLVRLYNLCSIFVFPSLHEGFGLPALEAMRCGAPTIAANNSSLPEVVGSADALFDAKSDMAMAKLMHRVISDDAYRSELVHFQKQHATSFSWDKSAIKAIECFNKALASKAEATIQNLSDSCPRRLRLAFVSPLPPAKSGIADYSADLLRELSKFYDIDVIVSQDEVINDAWIIENLPIRTSEWLSKYHSSYDRIIYHLGNSSYHQHMFAMLEKIPGMVVLHDFYLSNILAQIELSGAHPGIWTESIFASHGYHALLERARAQLLENVVWRYPANLPILQRALGVIVHSKHSLDLAKEWYGPSAAENWSLIPLLRMPVNIEQRESARARLGIEDNQILVCSFGVLGPTKLNHRLLHAWIESGLVRNNSARLVFVGENDKGEYGRALVESIVNSNGSDRIHITGWNSSERFQDYLLACDVAVQLRSMSRGETSAAVLDCLNYGIPTIVNAHGSMAELSSEIALKLPNEFSDQQLIDSLVELCNNRLIRESLSSRSREFINRAHNPSLCASLYYDSIELAYAKQRVGLTGLLDDLREGRRSEVEVVQLADRIGKTFPPSPKTRQILLDVSVLVEHDARSGIQRVVRNLLHAWLISPPKGCRVEPIYYSVDHGYLYARKFTARFMGFDPAFLVDAPIDLFKGDLFFSLDLHPSLQASNIEFYRSLRRRGVTVKFMVYDLLCIRHPSFFEASDVQNFSRWLNSVLVSDGVVCISESVSDNFREWLRDHSIRPKHHFSISWAHLGADILESNIQEAPASAKICNLFLDPRHHFLMVGTIEPRKGHDQVLDAFEHLWNRGIDSSLVIVGKQGWKVDLLTRRIRSHPEFNSRLFWIDDAQDRDLHLMYSNSKCLIAASYDEGFGLPLIEAAKHNLPILARNIPVFHEVAGEHAFYFSAVNGEDLAATIEVWMNMYVDNLHPKSQNIPYLTWKESAERFLDAIGLNLL